MSNEPPFSMSWSSNVYYRRHIAGEMLTGIFSIVNCWLGVKFFSVKYYFGNPGLTPAFISQSAEYPLILGGDNAIKLYLLYLVQRPDGTK